MHAAMGLTVSAINTGNQAPLPVFVSSIQACPEATVGAKIDNSFAQRGKCFYAQLFTAVIVSTSASTTHTRGCRNDFAHGVRVRRQLAAPLVFTSPPQPSFCVGLRRANPSCSVAPQVAATAATAAGVAMGNSHASSNTGAMAQVLSEVSLFSFLSDEETQKLATYFKAAVLRPDTAVVEQGTSGRAFYVIADGLVWTEVGVR